MPRTLLTIPVHHAPTRAGELPLAIVRMKAKGVHVRLFGNAPGFTLPTNIGELGDDITKLDLSSCSLKGTIVCHIIHAFVRFADTFLCR